MKKFYLSKALTQLQLNPASGTKSKSYFVLSAAIFFFTFVVKEASAGTHPGINNLKNIAATFLQDTVGRPEVISVSPEKNSINVDENTSISTNGLSLPNGGIDNTTITSLSVYLVEASTGNIVPTNANGSGGGDAITLVPDSSLKLNTTYIFYITDSVKDVSGVSIVPFSSTFTTGDVPAVVNTIVKFDKINLQNTIGQHSSLIIGPDRKLYALTIDGIIERYIINPDGTLQGPEQLFSLQDEYGARAKTLAIGFAFDPSSTAGNLIAWVTHSTYVFVNGPDWDGKLTKLSGNNLQSVQDVLINLPRSTKDHLTNSIVFGPDGALYFMQGSNSAMGIADKTWGFRNEHLLSAALLRLDLSKLTTLPLDVKTPEGGGIYNPYNDSSPLTIYASGIRNAYDFVWHSNGNLYAPTNGSSPGGYTPSSVTGTLRPGGSLYNGPVVPSLLNVPQTQHDYLFRIIKGGYYGHPNPLRGEYVLNGGNPTAAPDSAQVNSYPVGTLPDPNWRGFAFDFKNDKSPDGTIEYKSNTFNGSLKGKLMIVRYSQDKDIITLTPGGPANDIISAIEGPSIPGFSGFVDPLDLTEDPANGNIYVSEFGGKGKITLLRPKENIPGFGSVSVSPATVYDNYASVGDTGMSHLIRLKNIGSGNLYVSSINIAGLNSGEFVMGALPAFPLLLRAGSSISFKIIFTPSSAGKKDAYVNIKSDDALKPDFTLPLEGLGIKQLEVYPNPVHKKFTLAFPGGYQGDVSMQISDVAGRVYATENLTIKGVSIAEVDISKYSLNAGIYFLKINTNTGKMQVIKLLVQ